MNTCNTPPGKMHAAIADWYRRHGRHHLPWRQTKDPYHIYVSEIMLQQTQVKTVLERYYHPFLTRFPSLSALATAPQEEVLKAWEGLGYYTRAINLHRAAQACAPALPSTVEELLALPGVGRNTAHAVAALAFRRPVAVMEANVRRVICRFFALTTPKEAQLWSHAERLLGAADPHTYNQAMMDIGALVCTPAAPDCKACPLAVGCAGQSDPGRYPQKRKAKQTPVRYRHILLLRNADGALYMRPRTGRFLNGLYGFPEVPQHQAHATIQKHTFDLGRAEVLGSLTHTYSHFKLDAQVLLQDLSCPPWRDGWVLPEAIAEFPLSRADHKALALYLNFVTDMTA